MEDPQLVEEPILLKEDSKKTEMNIFCDYHINSISVECGLMIDKKIKPLFVRELIRRVVRKFGRQYVKVDTGHLEDICECHSRFCVYLINIKPPSSSKRGRKRKSTQEECLVADAKMECLIDDTKLED